MFYGNLKNCLPPANNGLVQLFSFFYFAPHTLLFCLCSGNPLSKRQSNASCLCIVLWFISRWVPTLDLCFGFWIPMKSRYQPQCANLPGKLTGAEVPSMYRPFAILAFFFCHHHGGIVQHVYSYSVSPCRPLHYGERITTDSALSRRHLAAVAETASTNSAALSQTRRNLSWMESFTKLQTFKDRHGHCSVPQTYTDDPKLAKWVIHQRRTFALGN